MSSEHPAVFLSYASQDATAVRRLCDTLRAAGVEVWFDQAELRGGDQWDAKIRKQIRECTLFVPVISAATQARAEGYFRREWKLAVERTHDMADHVPFLLPVVLDDTKDRDAHVPEAFFKVQWTRLPDGAAPPDFVGRVQSLLGEKEFGGIATGKVGRVSDPPHGKTTDLRRRPRVVLVASILLTLAAIGYFTLRPDEKPALANTTKPSVEVASAKSIAVLPFENLSTDKENQVFADGIHQDVIGNLRNVRDLRVTSRTTVMQYRGTTKSLRQLAQEMNVAYVLEGTVRRDGAKVRVSANLVDARTDAPIWTPPPYEGDLTAAGVFAIQSEIAQAIAEKLAAAISPEEKSLLTRRPTENLAAYELVLKARDAANRGEMTQANLVKQEALLQAAVALDANFATAWAELAEKHAFIYSGNYDHSDERRRKAKQAIDTAVRLAATDPDVIRGLANYLVHVERDYVRATAQLEGLVRLRPNDAEAVSSLGDVLQFQAKWSEALVALRRAAQLDPRNVAIACKLSLLLYSGRRWQELAGDEGRRLAAALEGQAMFGFDFQFISFAASGSKREVEAYFARLPAGQASSAEASYARKWWAIETGNAAEAARLERQHPVEPDKFIDEWNIVTGTALGLAAQGDRAGAQEIIREHYTRGRLRLEREPNNTNLLWILGIMEAIMDHKDEALRLARLAVSLVPEKIDAVNGPAATNRLAIVYAWTGEKELAIDEAARLLRTPYATMTVHMMRHDPWWFPLRGHPRFEALLADPKNNAPLF